MAEVSMGTVDRVLHNRGEVSERTQGKILRIIEELNYQPDILAKTLASRKRIRIAVIMPAAGPDNEFWQAPLKGIKKAYGEIGIFGLSLGQYFYNQFDKNSFTREASKILEAGYDAVLMAPVFSNETRSFCAALVGDCIPFILINANFKDSGCLSFIGQDAFQSGYVAGRLMSYGLEDRTGSMLVINIAKDKDNYQHIQKREKGFIHFMKEHSETSKLRVFRDGISSGREHEVNEYLSETIRSAKDLTGLFVTNSRVYAVAKFLAEQWPEKVRLIGYDLIGQNVRYMQEGIIDFLISQRPEEQGYRGLMDLFSHMVLEREIKREQYLPIEIITRENIMYYTSGDFRREMQNTETNL